MEIQMQTAVAKPSRIEFAKQAKQASDLKKSTPDLTKELSKGPVVQSEEMIAEAKKKQQRTMIIVAVIVIALSATAVWFFTRKKAA